MLAEAAPIWERTHAPIELRLPGADPDRLRAELTALATETAG